MFDSKEEKDRGLRVRPSWQVDIKDTYRRNRDAHQTNRNLPLIDIKEMVKNERDRTEYQLREYLLPIFVTRESTL